MKKTLIISSALFGLAILMTFTENAWCAPTTVKNAQSVQMHATGTGAIYQITAEGTWSFDYSGLNAALAAYNTYFTVSFVGTPNSSQINAGKLAAFTQNDCNFFNGAALAVVDKAFGANHVISTPVAPGQYPAHTGWTFATTGGQPIQVDISDLFVASESVQVKTTGSTTTTKYSFTLEEGNPPVSRLESLSYTLTAPDGTTIVHSGDLGTNFFQSLAFNQDWDYVQNGGVFGNLDAQTSLMDGDVNAILASDSFPNNNGTGGTQAQLIDSISNPLVLSYMFDTNSASGDYTLSFSGVVKGNSFVSNQPFTVTVTLVTINPCQ
jgi:hypothetical protein